MTTNRRRRPAGFVGKLAVAIVVLSLASLYWPRAIHAQVASVRTQILVEPLPSPQAGDHFDVVARLLTSGGAPVPEAGIEFLGFGTESRRRTDATGTAVLRVRENLSAGAYEITLVFNGATSRGLAATQASAEINIQPIDFGVSIVPAVPGVPVTLGEQTQSTDLAGHVSFEVTAAGDYPLGVPTSGDLSPDRRWVLRRWGSGGPDDSGLVHLPAPSDLELGIELHRRVALSFVDPDGDPVEADSIEQVELKNSIGEILDVASGDEVWARENNISRTTSGLIAPPISYGVSAVLMSGSNVVSRGQQRFFAVENLNWEIELLMYDVTFTVRDRVFGTAIGTAVELRYPDGRIERIPLDENATVTVESLPRGDYDVTVDAPGLRLQQPVAVSREQDVTLKVVSYIDITLGLGVLVLAAVAPLLFGRRHRLLSQAWQAIQGGRRQLLGPRDEPTL